MTIFACLLCLGSSNFPTRPVAAITDSHLHRREAFHWSGGYHRSERVAYLLTAVATLILLMESETNVSGVPESGVELGFCLHMRGMFPGGLQTATARRGEARQGKAVKEGR